MYFGCTHPWVYNGDFRDATNPKRLLVNALTIDASKFLLVSLLNHHVVPFCPKASENSVTFTIISITFVIDIK